MAAKPAVRKRESTSESVRETPPRYGGVFLFNHLCRHAKPKQILLPIRARDSGAGFYWLVVEYLGHGLGGRFLFLFSSGRHNAGLGCF